MNHAILNAPDGAPPMSAGLGPSAGFRRAARSRAATMPDTLIEVRDVERLFDGGAVAALRGVSFSVARGEFVSVMGPSGSGKSTLLHLIGALDTPSAGDIRYLGSGPAHDPRPRRVSRAHRSGSSSRRSTCCRRSRRSRTSRCRCSRCPGRGGSAAPGSRACWSRSGSRHRLHHLPSTLSGGERQRVAIARSLANGPAAASRGRADRESRQRQRAR